jgi:hypothetical protein
MIRDIEEDRFILRRRDTRHRAHFGIRQLPIAKGRIDFRQLRDRMCNPEFFPCRDIADTAMQVEPLGAARHAGGHPALAAVELGDQLQEPVGCGRQFTPEPGDLVFY